MGLKYDPRQLSVGEPSQEGGNYPILLTLSDSNTEPTILPVCNHSTWLAAWKCAHGNCTKGHNFNA